MPSSLTVFSVNGSEAESTCGELDLSSATVFSIFSLVPASRTVPPAPALKTTRAVAPSAFMPGKRWSSRSNAFCASVPGIENELSTAVGALAAATPARTSSATQRRVTK